MADQKPLERWRVELVLSAARWAQNMLAEVQGNHHGHIPDETRKHLHAAIAALAEIPHTIPTRIDPPPPLRLPEGGLLGPRPLGGLQDAVRALAEEPTAPLPAGTAVRFKRDRRRDDSFTGEHQQGRRGLDEGHGIVLKHSVGHGLCYLVKLGFGSRVWFDAEELRPLSDAEGCRGR
jgi:hypothetical protein